MSEQPKPQEEISSDDLAAEFQALGKNLKRIFVEAWESEERKNFQTELERGLSELGETLKQTAQEIQDSEAGQHLKAEAEDFRDRVRSGEVEEKIRNDLHTVLRKVNSELEQSTQPRSSSQESSGKDTGDE